MEIYINEYYQYISKKNNLHYIKHTKQARQSRFAQTCSGQVVNPYQETAPPVTKSISASPANDLFGNVNLIRGSSMVTGSTEYSQRRSVDKNVPDMWVIADTLASRRKIRKNTSKTSYEMGYSTTENVHPKNSTTDCYWVQHFLYQTSQIFFLSISIFIWL